jgi:hypothetical protein
MSNGNPGWLSGVGRQAAVQSASDTIYDAILAVDLIYGTILAAAAMARVRLICKEDSGIYPRSHLKD